MDAETKQSRHMTLSRRCVIGLLVMLLLSACVSGADVGPRKIALLAPFEGAHRDLGYNALYAVRLAMRDAGEHKFQLLAVDDGGSVESAIDRVRALNIDPAAAVIIALGESATHPSAQVANDKPLILIGDWGHARVDDDSLVAGPRSLAGGADDLRILERMIGLRGGTAAEIFVSGGALSDAEFSERYVRSHQYAPAPNWLATLTYDLTRLVLNALEGQVDIGRAAYDGITGDIRFTDGYWQAAPIHRYQIRGGELIALDD